MLKSNNQNKYGHFKLIISGFIVGPISHSRGLFFSSLSRRFIGDLIVYPCSDVRRPSVHRPQCSNIFFSETAWSIKAKFYVEYSWVGGTKACPQHLGHMTKMAAKPIYGNNPSNFSSPEPGGLYSSPSYFVQMTTLGCPRPFYDKVKFNGNLGFSVGKSENSAFFRKYSILRPEIW